MSLQWVRIQYHWHPYKENTTQRKDDSIEEVRASQVALGVKNPDANAEDVRDMCSIQGSERSPAGGLGNALQYSSLENPMDRVSLEGYSL